MKSKGAQQPQKTADGLRPDRYRCRVCKETKAKSEFLRNRRAIEGRDTICEECNRARSRHNAMPWHGSDEKAKAYRRANREKNNQQVLARVALVKIATPPWAREVMAFVNQEIIRLVRLRQKTTGFRWHRDHIVPLMGATVCGLNVPWNVRVIPGFDNMSKGNRL